jgi:predicted alpha/beta superfamily hydrolase
MIDELFYTLPEKEHTGVGGSSMGGIMAFYAYIYRPEVFGFSLSFSTPFFFYSKKHLIEIFDKHDINENKNGKLFLYCGGKEFESIFLEKVEYTYHYLKRRLSSSDHLQMIIDTSQIHHEKAWAYYLRDALRFVLEKK